MEVRQLRLEDRQLRGPKMTEVLLGGFPGTPAWMWLGFLAVVCILLVFDLGVLHRSSREIGVRGRPLLPEFS